MTRISATIRPEELCDQMLLAEHREIVRIPNMIKSGKAKLENIPDDFRLGSGHVKFFYNKIHYLYLRYKDLYYECVSRGFNVSCMEDSFLYCPKDSVKDWIPDEETVRPLLVQRINERLSNMKVIRYRGKEVKFEEIKL